MTRQTINGITGAGVFICFIIWVFLLSVKVELYQILREYHWVLILSIIVIAMTGYWAGKNRR